MIFFANVYHYREYYMGSDKKEASSYHTIEAETEDEARNILFEEFDSEQWLDKEIAQCVEIISLNQSKSINFEYDM